MVRIPSLRLLSGFEAAARLGNFSRAAEELHLSQSAISHQIQQLEEQLGQALFHRVGRGVELTVAGLALFKTTQSALQRLQNGISQISSYLDPGLVSIVCASNLAHGWLQAQLSAMRQVMPRLLPLVSIDDSIRFVDELDVDIFIGDTPLQQADVSQQILFRDQWHVVASSSVASDWNSWSHKQRRSHLGLICLEQSLSDEITMDVVMRQLNDFKRIAIFDDECLVLKHVLRSKGIACLPLSVIWDSIQLKELEILTEYQPVQGKNWWISRVSGDTRDALVIETFDFLLKTAKRIVIDRGN